MLIDEMLVPHNKLKSWEDVVVFLQNDEKVYAVFEYALDKGYNPDYIEDYNLYCQNLGYQRLIAEVMEAYSQLQL